MSKNRIKREQQTIAAMMVIYCTDHHHTNGVLCSECSQLLDYARRRLDTCPFQEEKPACNHCTVHCYSKDMRERVQQVMRYAGPRMMLRHPILSFYHLLDKFREVPELSKPKK
ncbi:MAG: nitrous oxide-stimulated promoter family protein [Candidatus Thiodiazotropha sp. (ex Lucinoma borealis)]|nr:nitrous oxide-stimulated promoter family protein [Candidatus Thiodiazotropha sp. (ex Lucinoma borealis)]MCU7856966.1 nitrous oxide-stimulated promoter family protein [Candidatus Thiodiazotropha sp. (ex Lucinoma borealis)]MCU7867769.1 nitrous oxide-stimulated promoter family protein [Candidatus Thiodiazotropha sp. (ex Lucinoma borealis)]